MSVILFGKLPAHGDFVARGLAPDARDRLDAWLSAALALARDAHGPAFDAGWDRAPPWRFVRPDGDGWQAGVVAASADRVGRRYPLLLARRVPAAAGAAALAAALEGLLATAFAGGWDGDRLLAAAAAVAPAPGGAPAAARWWVVDAADGEAAGFAPPPGDDGWPADLLRRMVAVAVAVAA